MHVISRLHCAPKSSRDSTGCEDAAWPPAGVNAFVPVCGFGIADGASNGFCTAPWAQMICRGSCQGVLADGRRGKQLAKLRRRWAQLAKPDSDAWYMKNAFDGGACTALAAITLRDANIFEEAGRFSALAVGDCALFQVRGNSLLTAFPYQHSTTFQRRPYQIASHAKYNRTLDDHIQRIEGWWESGDQFFLMTDAIAAWFLRQAEAHRWPWQTLRKLEQRGRDPRFGQWVNTLRREGQIQDDDVTLIHITVYEEWP